MGKFRSVFQLDDPFVEDGDISFIGLDQITEPTRLEPSIYTEAENVRIEEGVVKSRGGLKLMFQSQVPLRYNHQFTQLVTYSPPLGEEKLIVMGMNDNQYYITDSTQSNPSANIAFPQEFSWKFDNSVMAINTAVFNYAFRVIQAFDELILFPSYASGERPWRWNDTMNSWQVLSGTHTMYLTDETTGGYVDVNGNPSQVPVQDPSFFVCPQAPFGIYFQNRLIIPWFDDSPTSVAFSDTLNNNLFKKTNTFFLNRGQGDVLLALAPYLEDQVLCLCKKSIHIISNVSTLDSGGRATEITRQLGIAGVNAWTQNGSYIYFVSNEGDIQVLVPQLDPSKGLGIAISKVNLDSEPLSKKVPNIMKRVNVNAIDTAILHYHKNLVYCALPLDGANSPSHILIYDSLRSQFVGLDSFNQNLWAGTGQESLTNPTTTQSGFRIFDIHTFQDEVYISTDRQVFKYTDLKSDENFDIDFKLVTRSYLAQDYSIKKFVQGKITYDIGGERIRKKGISLNYGLNSDIEVGTKVKIISNKISSTDGLTFHPRVDQPTIIPYPLADEWLETGVEYLLSSVTRMSDGAISHFEIRKPNSTTDYVVISNWVRDVDYEVVVATKLEVSVNAIAPKSTTKVKEIESTISDEGKLQSYNIRKRGQSVNLEIKSNGECKIRSIQIEAVVQNARNVGDYS